MSASVRRSALRVDPSRSRCTCVAAMPTHSPRPWSANQCLGYGWPASRASSAKRRSSCCATADGTSAASPPRACVAPTAAAACRAASTSASRARARWSASSFCFCTTMRYASSSLAPLRMNAFCCRTNASASCSCDASGRSGSRKSALGLSVAAGLRRRYTLRSLSSSKCSRIGRGPRICTGGGCAIIASNQSGLCMTPPLTRAETRATIGWLTRRPWKMGFGMGSRLRSGAIHRR
mmetsp:Transcript_57736/g.151613  ORF Transcript_57736/g.151613 Transcript_57736/m.151613 type:complete len:236 (+) Transcript_57736:476-1183(+)